MRETLIRLSILGKGVFDKMHLHCHTDIQFIIFCLLWQPNDAVSSTNDFFAFVKDWQVSNKERYVISFTLIPEKKVKIHTYNLIEKKWYNQEFVLKDTLRKWYKFEILQTRNCSGRYSLITRVYIMLRKIRIFENPGRNKDSYHKNIFKL